MPWLGTRTRHATSKKRPVGVTECDSPVDQSLRRRINAARWASPDPIQHLAPRTVLSVDRLEPPGNAGVCAALHQDVITASRNAADGNLKTVRSWSKPVQMGTRATRASDNSAATTSRASSNRSARTRGLSGSPKAANHTETGTLNRPATAELVEAGHGVGEHLRAATGQRGDSGSDAQSRGRLRDGGQCHPGVS